MSPSTTPHPNEKTVRLVEYLQRVATLRSKLIRDITEYEKILWISSIPHERGCFTRAWGRDDDHEPDEWIEVQNQREPGLPAVPAQCKDWVESDVLWNKTSLPALLPEITRPIRNPDWCEGSDQPKIIFQTDLIENHPAIQRTWDQYVEEKWQPWTKTHDAWEKVNTVYASLFSIHQEQLRLGEEYELVLGLGLLTWQTPAGQRVRRHLIIADAALEFEARLAKFIVRPHTEGARLRPELDMLDIEEQPVRAEEAAKVALSGAEDDPWEKGCIDGVLQALVHSINPQSDYDDFLEAKSVCTSAKPVVEYAPALILRRRSVKGLNETLKQIRAQIENGGDIPGEFADLAEVRAKNDWDQVNPSTNPNAELDGEIFFPKPSNDEQRRIVDKMRTANGVLVQGPPGTGKSHTIANLICHLLATGQRALITAKTPRALQVLEGLVPPELRPLCINLLGSGVDERRSLESSVGGILRQNEEWKEDRAREERTELEAELRKLREEKTQVDRRLRDIRESETHTQSIAEGAYKGTAARIAEAVDRNRALYAWFTDVVSLQGTCQISPSALTNILSYLRRFTPEKRKELDLVWPDITPSLEDFPTLVKNEASASKNEENIISAGEIDEHLVDMLTRCNPSTIEAIAEHLSSLCDARNRLMVMPHQWMKDAVRDILSGNSSVWRELLRVTQDAMTSIRGYVSTADTTTVEFPNICDIRALYEDAKKLKRHMDDGGKMGWWVFRPKVVKDRLYVTTSVKINGRFCVTTEHLSTLVRSLQVRIECEKAWNFWAGRSDRTKGPYALQMTAFNSLCSALESALSLEGSVGKCRKIIQLCSTMGEPPWGDEARLECIIQSCRLALARLDKQNAVEEIHHVESPIASMVSMSNAHPETEKLLIAVRKRDMDGFSRSTTKLKELTEERLSLQKGQGYLIQLRHLLPRLADDLKVTCNDSCWDDRIPHIGDAWHWAQARYWIEDYIRQEDMPALAKRARQIEDESNAIVAKLASLHAWSFCFSRLKEDHRRHMEAWQQSMRRLGKGTGKHAHRHRREAQGHLNECREAVPAWVMPLHRVWDTVYPEPGMFDVIIIDEASQCGVEALPLFYLGKKILIVGDDKQISPDAVGLPRDAIHRLMKEFIDDFHFKSSFDIESSLFDHGKLRYGTNRITLREHFRCMPEIIRFSNDLCYSDTPLIPLRQYGPNRLPPLEHVFVSGGYREGTANRTINRPEAEAVVSMITKLCDDSRYDDMSMGVVVLQGEAQATLIENDLLKRLGAEEMEKRRIVCGNPYSFQGDERDIMFLSLVAANNKRIGPLTKPADERRFNVAASRARDRMILFHSVTCDDLSAMCLRRKLLNFFENTKPQQIAGIQRNELERRAAQDNRKIVRPPAPFESWFEVDVALELLRKHFVVLPQYKVAEKRIDLVVEGGQTRLAVECDGDNWHGADQYENDMHRQRQLERCGWKFFRVRESAFYLNRGDVLKGLWDALAERGILPEVFHVSDGIVTSDPQDEAAVEERYEGESAKPIHEDKSTTAEPQKNKPEKPIHESKSNIKVEVEDTVLYVDLEEPQTEKQVLITRAKSNPDWGYININTPIARALTGATVGSTVEAMLPKGTVLLLIKEIRKTSLNNK